MEDQNKNSVDYGGVSDDRGSLTRPLHISQTNWEERTRMVEDAIRDRFAFEGKWQSYIKDYRLYVPDEMRPLLEAGGVITFSTEEHLLLFGHVHWSRFQRLLSRQVGLSPVNNSVARHIYSSMHRFSKLNDDGSIELPLQLAHYADIDSEVAIIGMVYHAEIHNKESYIESERTESRKSLLEKFKRATFK